MRLVMQPASPRESLMHTTPPSLLERIRKPGDDLAWERFVALYTPFIFSLARKSGLGREESSDLVQDVFLLLTAKMVAFQYDATQSFRAWLRTVVVNRIRQDARHRTVLTVSVASQFDLGREEACESFEESEYRTFLMTRAFEIMQREFSPTTWKACWEHVVSGRTASEVGTELGITEGAVYVAKFRVLRRLREELEGLL